MPVRIKQAAAMLGISTQTLMELEQDGLIQPLRSRGNHRYFTPEILEAAKRAYFTPKTKIQRKAETVSM
jgi:DNA-binding transcriptional MerR regulator